MPQHGTQSFVIAVCWHEVQDPLLWLYDPTADILNHVERMVGYVLFTLITAYNYRQHYILHFTLYIPEQQTDMLRW